jgi:hypothetical protein
VKAEVNEAEVEGFGPRNGSKLDSGVVKILDSAVSTGDQERLRLPDAEACPNGPES